MKVDPSGTFFIFIYNLVSLLLELFRKLDSVVCFNMKFVMMKQCKLESTSREKGEVNILIRNGRVLKFSRLFS